MAITPEGSVQYLNYSASPQSFVNSDDWNSKLRVAYGKLTFTAAGTGSAPMIRMPAGKVRILTDLCRIVCPAGTATADLHVGHSAYVEPDGTAVNADDNAFADNLDVGAGAIDAAFSLPAAGYLDIESKSGFDIEILIDTANSPASGDCIVIVVYQAGN